MLICILFIITIPLLLLILMLIIECAAALLPTKQLAQGRRSPCTILVPAHNEALVLEKTVVTLQKQLLPDDRILVVADNCTDETANIARNLGVQVYERFDQRNRGKGFALDAGINVLKDSAPEVVIIVDADCIVQPNSIDQLVRAVQVNNAPVQALYIMEPPRNASVGKWVSAFAFIFKNHVRARGLARLGFRVNLTGTGMAFLWQDITSVNIANSNIVEDMAMGVELMVHNRGAIFLESAEVRSVLPATEAASDSQRTRWEHGHLQTLVSVLPRLVWKAWVLRRPSLLVNVLDLAVPPLSLFCLFNVFWLLILLGAALWTGQWLLVTVYVFLASLAFAGIVVSWYCFARHVIPASVFLAVPTYVLSKLSIYRRFLGGRETKWVRTDRDE